MTLPARYNPNIINPIGPYLCDKSANFVVLPAYLTHLTFGTDFDREIGHKNCGNVKCPKNLPNTLTHLNFGFCFNKKVDNLPKKIIVLVFGHSFNQSVDKLPNSITHLTFGDLFNQKIDKLPDSITHLVFGNFFQKNIEILPKSITHLVTGTHFNQNLPKLPNTITYLKIYGATYGLNNKIMIGHTKCKDDSCPKNLPNSLITLVTNINTLDKLPESIKNLTIEEYNTNVNLNLLPNTLTHLTLNTNIKNLNKLPSDLTYLKLNKEFNSPVGHSKCKNNNCSQNLPFELTHLIFGEHFNQCVDYLPEKLKIVTFGKNFNQIVDSLPNSITHLTFGETFNQKIDLLPTNLTHLILGYEFNREVEFLPNSVTHLIFGFSFKSNLRLPQNICYLELGFKFNKGIIYGLETSENLKEIKLFYCSNIIKNIPCFIETLHICYEDIKPKNNKSYDISNIPISVSSVKIDNNKLLNFIKKIPCGCVIYNEYGNPITTDH